VRVLKPIAKKWLLSQRASGKPVEPAQVAALAVDEFQRFLSLGERQAGVRSRLTQWVAQEAAKHPPTARSSLGA
jgi:hypothetical protein